MTGFLAALETIALLALTVLVARRARAAEPTRGRLAAIGALLAVQGLLLVQVMARLVPALWREGQGVLPALLWLTQAARASLLLFAFAQWYRISLADQPVKGGRVVLGVSLLALAFGGAMLPFLALIALTWLTGTPAWARELSGWRRFAVLILGPLLLLLLSFAPFAVAKQGAIAVQFAPFADPWQASLVSSPAPAGLRGALALARPLDRLIQALVDLFRVQLLILTFRALTMPLRLYGSSLKRRFTVNYIFVRSIPSALAFVSLLALGYVAFGVQRAGSARGEFERTVARAEAACGALLDQTRALRDTSAMVAALESARPWLAPDGARAHLVLRRHGDQPRHEISHAATAGAPAALLVRPLPQGRDGRSTGLVEDGTALYLFAHRMEPDSARVAEVFVPLDSVYLGGVEHIVRARTFLTLDRGVSSNQSRVRFTLDDTTRGRVRIAAHGPVTGRPRGFLLGRAYLPLGDWSTGWREGAEGAVSLELRTTGRMLLGYFTDVPGWLFSNIVMVGLLILLGTLIGTVESIAVRSGRGIMKTIEEEVASLRESVARFGAGDLGHRAPVRGRDELSALAGSFNEMAANLERQRAELIGKERMEEDLEVARAIQLRFLPQKPPTVPGLDVAGISVPSREVGGDLFHYAELPGGRLAVALGDVSGKSVPAALIMSNVISALRAETQHEAEIEKSLTRINRLLMEQIEPGRFVTLVYGIIDPDAGVMRYASAGHNPMLRVSANGDLMWLREGGVPLGIDTDTAYASAQVPVAAGDVLVAYSDGVTEADGPERDGAPAMFGDERLAEAVRSLRGRSAGEIVAGVQAAVQRFSAGRAQADDITLVVVRRT
jgi:serine phosphatase RsbU (regulator of sigma subunit)